MEYGLFFARKSRFSPFRAPLQFHAPPPLLRYAERFALFKAIVCIEARRTCTRPMDGARQRKELGNMKRNLQTLYEDHFTELVAFARQRVGADEARDVVHDAYLRVLKYGDGNPVGNPRAYLYQITSNAAKDHGAQASARASLAVPDVEPDTLVSPNPGPDETLSARRNLQHCMSALAELPNVYRHVFLLHRVDGMAQAEIAQALKIPKRTVERYIAKALAHCLERVYK
jgi:RNA polymerase sigma factor (sigma-70 family)